MVREVNFLATDLLRERCVALVGADATVIRRSESSYQVRSEYEKARRLTCFRQAARKGASLAEKAQSATVRAPEDQWITVIHSALMLASELHSGAMSCKTWPLAIMP
jgi:hypothetical protein